MKVPFTGFLSYSREKLVSFFTEVKELQGFVLSFKEPASSAEAVSVFCVLAPAKNTQISNLPELQNT